MTRTKTFLAALGVLILIAGLGLLRLASVRRRGAAEGDGAASARERLNVGFLPVT